MTFVSIMTLFFSLAAPQFAQATGGPASAFYDFTQPFFQGCGNNSRQGDGAGISFTTIGGKPGNTCGWGDLEFYIGKAMLLLIGVGILVSTLAIAWAGFRLIYSQGNSAELDKAKKQLWAIIVGFFFMLAAFLIVKFILTSLGVSTDYYSQFIGS
jgi:hypothetical protein